MQLCFIMDPLMRAEHLSLLGKTGIWFLVGWGEFKKISSHQTFFLSNTPNPNLETLLGWVSDLDKTNP